MNKFIREVLPTPTGWLMQPVKKLVLFFIREQKSLMRLPTIITQLWYSTKEGIPMNLKNTRKIDYDCAIETWNELLSNGWELVEQQMNKDVA